MSYTNGLDNPELYFQNQIWDGNGSTNAITFDGSENMQPDMVWIKITLGSNSGVIHDSVRGTTKRIETASTGEESTVSSFSSFDTDGFTLSGNDGYVNTNDDSNTYCAWSWKAGTSFTNDASSTGIGTIDSTGSVNETAGFSIVSYTSTGSNGSIKHGLSTAPSMMIFKRRSGDTENWPVYHQALGNTHYVMLNATDAQSSSTARFNDTSPTSSVFTVGTSGDTNGGSSPFICYCFSERKGYSKFGSYTGNGNADGTFVYTGFKPAFVMVKPTTTADNWVMLDNKRLGYNPDNNFVYANKAFGQNDADIIDFTSNGFKQTSSGGTSNRSGDTFIYMAFSESPFTNSSGVPNNAR